MFFCPKCNYSLDIGNFDQDVKIDIDEYIKNVLEKKIVDTIPSVNDVKNHESYKKLDSKKKKIILKDLNNSRVLNKIQFLCKNCKFRSNSAFFGYGIAINIYFIYWIWIKVFLVK